MSVEHIALYAKRHDRLANLDSFTLKGSQPEKLKKPLKWDFRWREDNTGPKNWDKIGVSGISIPKYDQTICTGCSAMYNPLLMFFTSAYKGTPFEGIEVLSGKKMKPSPSFNKTILFGKCMIKKNRNDPNIKEAVYIEGCPVGLEKIIEALRKMGIHADLEFYPRFRESLVQRYEGNPDFNPGHYFLPGATG